MKLGRATGAGRVAGRHRSQSKAEAVGSTGSPSAFTHTMPWLVQTSVMPCMTRGGEARAILQLNASHSNTQRRRAWEETEKQAMRRL